MKKLKLLFLVCLCTLLAGCWANSDHVRLQSMDSVPFEKKVVLIVVDSLLEQPLETLMKQKRVPAFSFLKEHGLYTNQMISSFPTMSVTIDSTILTGTYPNEHHIPALRWYSYNENRLIQYGDGVFPILKSGVKQVMIDSLLDLNQTHLNRDVATIHEELAEKGIPTASINTLLYRGKDKQTLKIPGPFKDLETDAPPYFVLGTFHSYQTVNLKDQVIDYYGVNDAVSVKHTVDLIKKKQLPPFTMMYMPDLDHEAHKHGKVLVQSVLKVDQQLQEIFNAFGGSWEKALKDHVFMVMGDSGVTKIKDDKKKAIVDLESLFHMYRIADLNKTEPEDQLSLAVNERMAYVYPLKDSVRMEDVVVKLQDESRLDLISWKNGEWIEVRQGGSRESFRFRKGTRVTDPYQQKWDLDGNLGVLDLKIESGNRLQYNSYPDGLMRLYAALHSHPGNFLTLTSKPGYEMTGESSPVHTGGGAHGSLHKEDTYAPLFIAGTKEKPVSFRMVDLKPFILGIIDNEKSKGD